MKDRTPLPKQCFIVSSALSAEAKILYSEDMNSSLVIEKKLTIINPLSV